MKILGIVGGIGSGKSEVARMFGELGATILNADLFGHEALKDPQVKQIAATRWGESVLLPNGELNRAEIASRVFDPSLEGCDDRAFWEKLVHPKIRKQLEWQIRQETQRNPHGIAVLDAALLLEAGWNAACSAIVFVDAPLEIRRQWVRDRGWTELELENRERAQWTLEEKRKHADYVIDNSGSCKQTYDQVLDIWKVYSGNVGPSPFTVKPPDGQQ